MKVVHNILGKARSAFEGARASVSLIGVAPRRPAGVRLNFDLNDGCNIQCVMCSKKSSAQSVMDVETFRERFVATLQLVDAFQLGCQFEPLMVPYFEVALASISQNLRPGVKGRFVSNAMLLSERRIAAIIDSDIFDLLTFSIDACTAELYEKIRRGARFDRFVRNVSSLVAYRSRQRSGCKISFNFTVMPMNVHELPGLISMASDLGIDAVSTHRLYPDDYAVIPEPYFGQIHTNMALAAEKASESGINFSPDTSYLGASSTDGMPAGPAKTRCRLQDNRITLRSECSGELYAPCRRIRSSLGNLRKDDLDGIIRGNKFQHMLGCFGKVTDSACVKCPNYV